MEPSGKDRNEKSGQQQATDQTEPADENTPSADAEIEPGINQDQSPAEGFSSEPDEEASGTEDT